MIPEHLRVPPLGSIRIVFSEFVEKGKIYPDPLRPDIWIAHSREDFEFLWDKWEMAKMGIKWEEATLVVGERVIPD